MLSSGCCARACWNSASGRGPTCTGRRRPEKLEGGRSLVIRSDFEPKGYQPQAIADLVEGVTRHDRTQVLLGVTGSGKTFTMAKVIEEAQRPAWCWRRTRPWRRSSTASSRSFFPDNAVEYFVSYHDYYQPEAYVPPPHLYREGILDQRADRPHAPLGDASLLERDDVIIVASVSCIYGIGSVETYSAMTFTIKQGERLDQRSLIADLVALQYKRSAGDFFRGAFRLRGDVIQIFPPTMRIALGGCRCPRRGRIDPRIRPAHRAEDRRVRIREDLRQFTLATPRPTLLQAIDGIRQELRLGSNNSTLPAACSRRSGSSSARSTTSR